MRWFAIPFVLGLIAFAPTAGAQVPDDAKWIWFDTGDPGTSAPAGKVWFRREVRAEEPSTGAVRSACDDHFILWVNGQKVGSGNKLKNHRFNLNGIVERGLNVICVEATNTDGKAGLFVDGEVRGQSGRSTPFDSGAEWNATTVPPQGDGWLKPGFDDKDWKPAKVIAAHKDSPWKEIQFAGTYLDRYDPLPGFEIQRIAEPKLVGTLVAITWGNRGRLIASREKGPILSVIDEDRDGQFDKVVEYSTVVQNCQGLCMVFDDLYAVGKGPEGTGIYRLPDRDHDDKADEAQLVIACKGNIGDHGPHDVIYGPDGWLYHNLGNHAWITKAPEATTACRNYEEGYLLEPKFEDAGGHAAGIKAPGGTIWRFTPDGKKWWMETNGFRNEYDFAFNWQGDMFAFDSDMEWDVNLPWYRPIRVNHCIPGAEFGWRSGAAKWPAYYFDSLPAAIDIGRGSPTGVLFYEHTQFPEKYRGSMVNCDWSMGRIIMGFLKPEGSSFGGTFETLVNGNPLNVSDVEVDRDGTLVFSTGGRGTEGGLYRVTYTGNGSKPAQALAADTLDDALAMPQLAANWAREAIAGIKAKVGERWEPELVAKVKQGTTKEKVRALTLLCQFGPKPSAALLYEASADEDAIVRAFATWLLGDHPSPATSAVLAQLLRDRNPVVQRRACEAFVRTGLEAPWEPLVALLLDSRDRSLRFAARIALERVPAEKWKEHVLKSEEPDVALNGLLALHRLGPSAVDPNVALQKLRDILGHTEKFSRQQVDALRMLELQVIVSKQGPILDKLGSTLLSLFNDARIDSGKETPTRTAVRFESARLLAALQVPGATAALIDGLATARNSQSEMHYALCLRYLNVGWTLDLKHRLLAWYETTREWEGGNSLQGYLRNIIAATLERYTPEERKELLQTWKQHPWSTRLLLSESTPEQVRDYDQVIDALLAEVEKSPSQGGELVSLTINSLGKSNAESAQRILRKMYDDQPDRRELVVRALAAHPSVESWPYLVKSLQFGDNTTLQACLQALKSIDKKPENADQIRLAILAGLKLENRGGRLAANLLQQWTGSDFKSDDVPAALAHYQAWYREKYPQAPAPELAKEDVDKNKYSFQQLVDLIEKSPQAEHGDAKRGREIYAKANCIKCHKFLKDGEGVGPDLTSLRRRFQRKEIIESILTPSQVVSDQYRSVTIATTDGRIYAGMPLPDAGKPRTIVLLLSDATKVEIPKDTIDENVPSKASVMPEGLLKELSPQDIVDLFAFLETSKSNPEPITNAAAGK